MKKVFISYSSQDEKWLKLFRPYLNALERHDHTSLWVDVDMAAGEPWSKQIDEALETADVAVLLVSQPYLDSRFIVEREIEAFVRRAEEGTLRLYPVLLSPCTWPMVDWISEKQWRPKERKSLQEIEDERKLSQAQFAMVDMVNEIRAILLRLAQPAVEIDVDALGQPAAFGGRGYVTVDMRLEHFDGLRYRVEISFSQSPTDQENFRRYFYFLLHVVDLEQFRGNPDRYRQELTQALFRDEGLCRCLEQVRDYADEKDQCLRIRLIVDPNARELNRVMWELLAQGDTQINPLLCRHGRTTVLHRFVAGQGENWAEVQLRPKSDLHLYVGVGASPPVSPEFGPIHAESEYGVLKTALSDEAGQPKAPLASIDQLPTTLSRIGLRDQLMTREPDSVLYLTCHVTELTSERQPALMLLADGAAPPTWVPAEDLAESLSGLPLKPRLVVLVPSQTDGTLRGNAEYARAASALLQAGIAAALTLQGPMSTASWLTCLNGFLARLDLDPKLDVAIHDVRETLPDHEKLAPVLFSRLKTARLWYRPGFLLERGDPEVIWTKIIENIRNKRCTPIIGPAVSQTLSRSRRQISRALADEHLYPMALHGRVALAQVAQYIAVDKARLYPRQSYRKQVMRFVLARFGEKLTPAERSRFALGPDEEKQMGEEEKERLTAELVELVGGRLIEDNNKDPHMVLARLDLPLYISANWNRLLAVALKKKDGEDPEEYLFAPDPDGEDAPEGSREAVSHEGAPRKKVFYAFGLIGGQSPLVLTEDDYLDFLLRFCERKFEAMGPGGSSMAQSAELSHVLKALSASGLLFLGFRMEHWDFRVLFRIISSLEGGRKRVRMTHVAVQVDPDDDYVMDPERTRRYLSKYFDSVEGETALYWGTAEDFLLELDRRMR